MLTISTWTEFCHFRSRGIGTCASRMQSKLNARYLGCDPMGEEEFSHVINVYLWTTRCIP